MPKASSAIGSVEFGALMQFLIKHVLKGWYSSVMTASVMSFKCVHWLCTNRLVGILDLMKTEEGLPDLPNMIHKDDPMLVQVKPELGESAPFANLTSVHLFSGQSIHEICCTGTET